VVEPLWVVVGNGLLILYSSDGDIWTEDSTVSGVAGKGGITFGQDVTYGKDGTGAGCWVAVGNGSNIAHSPDENNWTAAATIGDNTNARGVAFNKII
jgi:hypothetical protein